MTSPNESPVPDVPEVTSEASESSSNIQSTDDGSDALTSVPFEKRREIIRSFLLKWQQHAVAGLQSSIQMAEGSTSVMLWTQVQYWTNCCSCIKWLIHNNERAKG